MASTAWDSDSFILKQQTVGMDDEAVQLVQLLKSQLEGILDLLDQHDLTLPAAWLTMSIDAMPAADDLLPPSVTL